MSYAFVVFIYDLFPPLDEFVHGVPSRIGRSNVEEDVEPVFEVVFVVEGRTASHCSTGSERGGN